MQNSCDLIVVFAAVSAATGLANLIATFLFSPKKSF